VSARQRDSTYCGAEAQEMCPAAGKGCQRAVKLTQSRSCSPGETASQALILHLCARPKRGRDTKGCPEATPHHTTPHHTTPHHTTPHGPAIHCPVNHQSEKRIAQPARPGPTRPLPAGVFSLPAIKAAVQEAVKEACACEDEAKRRQMLRQMQLRWHPGGLGALLA